MSKEEKQLTEFMDKYTPEVVALARAVRAKLRARLPHAVEMVYDNWNGLVMGFSPTERPSDAILSILMVPKWVTLCFLKGATLRDPKKLLQGSGSQVRHVRLYDADAFDAPDLRALIDAAVAASPVEMSGAKLIIKSVSAKQRPRRPGKP